ncbi:MAG: hypothetical protein JEZ09_13900 [Salinivirgaceae bacterium]|nr:hypothetical protein [Salinivirgaceae bacterium]
MKNFKNYFLIGFVLVLGLVACEKDNDDDNNKESSDLWSGILDTKYYNEEILHNIYLDFYGQWGIEKIDGGYSGMGYTPDFDYLEIKNYGIYGFVRNDSLLEYGKIEIMEQNSEKLWIKLQRDENSDFFFNEIELNVELPEKDSMNLFSLAMDGFNYYFNKME